MALMLVGRSIPRARKVPSPATPGLTIPSVRGATDPLAVAHLGPFALNHARVGALTYGLAPSLAT
jgi:hypothetical protein